MVTSSYINHILLSNCKVNGQTYSVKPKSPCIIYFAILSFTITINKQMSPKTFFLIYITPYALSSGEILIYLNLPISEKNRFWSLKMFPYHFFHPNHVIPVIKFIARFMKSSYQLKSHTFMKIIAVIGKIVIF